MGWKVALGGVAGAALLGLALGGGLRPTLATRAEGPVDAPAAGVGESGPVDLTPAYVSPQSLQAWRAEMAPPSVAPDRTELQVRRELAQANAELRASEAALDQYRQAAALVGTAVQVADHLGEALSAEPGPAAVGADLRLAPAPASRAPDSPAGAV